MDKVIKPARQLEGKVLLPGDKSISHRALILGAIADGSTEITNLSNGKDVRSTRDCLRQLGVQFEERETKVIVQGRGLKGLSAPARVLDAGNSGTTVRLLSGILAAQPFESTLTGDESLLRRPMSRIVEPLARMGAKMTCGDGGTLPLKIRGGVLRPIEHVSAVASAQVKSCVLLAGLFAEGRTTVEEPSVSRNHTERMLPCFGVDVQVDDLAVSLDGPAQPLATSITVPGDISAAAFLLVAGCLVSKSELVLERVGTNPSRIGIIEVLVSMGASIKIQDERIVNNEPVEDISVQTSELAEVDIGGKIIPRVIDELPVLAIAATQANGRTTIRDAQELRVKESDRIKATVENLRRMGAKVEELPNGMSIDGPQQLHGTEIESFGDHRIAMAFAVAALGARGETIIKNAECAEISFPGFFEMLERLRSD